MDIDGGLKAVVAASMELPLNKPAGPQTSLNVGEAQMRCEQFGRLRIIMSSSSILHTQILGLKNPRKTQPRVSFKIAGSSFQF